MKPAAEEVELAPHFERLVQEACRLPGQWASTVLVSGWKFMVLCCANGHHAIRFRTGQVPGMVWLDFLVEARRLATLLGCTGWKLDESDRRAFFEVSFISPAPMPAFSQEAR
jgi:hypothetical protein